MAIIMTTTAMTAITIATISIMVITAAISMSILTFTMFMMSMAVTISMTFMTVAISVVMLLVVPHCRTPPLKYRTQQIMLGCPTKERLVPMKDIKKHMTRLNHVL